MKKTPAPDWPISEQATETILALLMLTVLSAVAFGIGWECGIFDSR